MPNYMISISDLGIRIPNPNPNSQGCANLDRPFRARKDDTGPACRAVLVYRRASPYDNDDPPSPYPGSPGDTHITRIQSPISNPTGHCPTNTTHVRFGPIIADVSGFPMFTKKTKMKERKNAPISFDGHSSYRF